MLVVLLQMLHDKRLVITIPTLNMKNHRQKWRDDKEGLSLYVTFSPHTLRKKNGSSNKIVWLTVFG